MQSQIFIPTKNEFKEILSDTVDKILARRIPEIIRQANRKEHLTTGEVQELTGLSSRMQKYHREAGNLAFSQSGRKIIYRTVDVEKFIDNRRIAR